MVFLQKFCCQIPAVFLSQQFQRHRLFLASFPHLVNCRSYSLSPKSYQIIKTEGKTLLRPKLLKGSLKIMEVDLELFRKIITPEMKTLAELFEKYGYELRIAGGAVRDLLVGKLPADIDFATTATPTEMKAMFDKENVRMICATGEKHGTITPRINDKENFEVTTLRIDVVTDGRHAEVQFTKNWELDAGRRDLTINSMFLDLNGNVYDYFNGAEDMKQKRVRFVGDPVQRIQEDYLRILRYFRFYGRIADKPDEHDDATLEAIKDYMHGLKQISGERIWMELSKILSGNFSASLILKMIELGIAPYVGLPENCDIEELKRVSEQLQKHDLTVHPITLFSALLRTKEEVANLHLRLRLSTFERDLSYFIILYRKEEGIESSIVPFQRIVIFSKNVVTDVRRWVEEVYKYNGAVERLVEFREWNLPKFPVSGHKILERKVKKGRTMQQVMVAMKNIWIESEFSLSEEELLKELPQILENINENSPNSPKPT